MTPLLLLMLAAPPQPVNLAFEDQFDRKPDLASVRGGVVVLVYGDRKGMDACKKLGEELHVTFHPAAKGLTPAKAREQAVVPLAGAKASPDVSVIPVACCGKIPSLVRPILRGQFKKGAPEVPVWLDFDETMVKHFGMTEAAPNVAVFDALGQFRHKSHGKPGEKETAALIQLIQNLRGEAAK